MEARSRPGWEAPHPAAWVPTKTLHPGACFPAEKGPREAPRPALQREGRPPPGDSEGPSSRSRSRRGVNRTGPCPAPQDEASGPVGSLLPRHLGPVQRPAPPHSQRNLRARRGAPDSPARARQWRRFRCAAEVRALGADNYKSQKAARRAVGAVPGSRAPLAVPREARRGGCSPQRRRCRDWRWV